MLPILALVVVVLEGEEEAYIWNGRDMSNSDFFPEDSLGAMEFWEQRLPLLSLPFDV